MKLFRWLLYILTLGMARHPNAPPDSAPILAVHAFTLDYAFPFEVMYVRKGRKFFVVSEWDYGCNRFMVYDADGHRHELGKTDDVWCVMRPKGN